MAELPNYVKDYVKQVVITRSKNLRPLFVRDKEMSIQKICVGDFVVARFLNGKKLEVFTVDRSLNPMPVVGKKVRNEFIKTVNENKILKDWLMNDEIEFPKGLLWSAKEVYENKTAIGKWYGLDLFMPELSDEEIDEIVPMFDACRTQNQFVNIDLSKHLDNINKPVTTMYPVESDKVKNLFKCLPKEYAEFIVNENQQEDNLVRGSSKSNTNWNHAKKLPDFISVGVLYHEKEAIRFTDVIMIDNEGKRYLYSMYNIGKGLKPTDANLLLFGLRIESNIKRMIYVTHRLNPVDGTISSHWKLFKRRKRK